jgi:putative ABC transport system ATP-binding protein
MSTVDVDQGTQRGLEVVARDIHVSYDGHEVLRAVDLRVAPGQMVAVTGPSGAGKTTLLWVLAALVRPEQGEVTVDGSTPRDRDETAAAGVVLIPQDNALATVLTAAENVLVPLLAAKVPPADAHDITTWALEIVGLGEAGDQLVEELSGGQQQRVAVARGLAQQGTVVLADEPTSELDAVNRSRIVALLRAEAERGASVVLATHDPDAAAECDAELHLDAGVATWVRRPSLP